MVVFIYELVRTSFGFILSYFNFIYWNPGEQIPNQVLAIQDVPREEYTGLEDEFVRMTLNRGGKLKNIKKTRKNKNIAQENLNEEKT